MAYVKASEVGTVHRVVTRTDRGTVKAREKVLSVIRCVDRANVHIETETASGSRKVACYFGDTPVEIG